MGGRRGGRSACARERRALGQEEQREEGGLVRRERPTRTREAGRRRRWRRRIEGECEIWKHA